VREHGIGCEWSERGRIHAAVESHSLRSLEALISVLEASGEPHAVLERDALERAIGTRHYARGVHVPSTILVQPAALVRGLARALPANVDLFEESPVVAMQRRKGWELRTPSGSIRAPTVIAALNGLSPALGLLGRRILPLHTFASLTRELRPEERAVLGESDEWGLVSQDRMGTTLRLTQSSRLLVRNHQVYAPSLRVAASEFGKARALHRGSIARRWPSLAHVEIEHTWAGVLGVTMNQGTCFGRVADGLFAWAGCNGTGVALGTALGTLLAEHALGRRPELLREAVALRKPAWLPHAPFLGIGVRATLGLLGSRAGEER
jgi:glycine/D-amino acid oxidase-like deaminating enzyme